MVAVALGTIISAAVAIFALLVVLREFQGRWHQIVAALAFDERAFVTPGLATVRPSVAPRSARLVPAPVRRQRQQRAAA